MKTHYDIELFHWAGMPSDNVEQVKDILEEYPEYVFSTNRVGDSPLFVAIQVGNYEIVKYLIENTEVDVNFQFKDSFDILGDNALMYAVKYKQDKIISYLLENTEINIKAINGKGQNIFHLSAFRANGDLIEKLIENGYSSEINLLDKDNEHPLYDFIDNYLLTKDLWVFDLLLENMDLKTLSSTNKKGFTIIDYINKIINENNLVIKDFQPLVHMIKSRLGSS